MGHRFLDVISQPDEAGLACDFQAAEIDLTPGWSTFGLVNLMSNYDEARSNIPVEMGQMGRISSISPLCGEADSLVFAVEAPPGIDLFSWSLSPELSLVSASFISSKPQITVRFSGEARQGSLSVYGLDTNNCAYTTTSETYHFDLSEDIGTVGQIQGEPLICEDQGPYTYTTDVIPKAESYLWQLPPGAYPLNGDTVTSQPEIQIDFDASFREGEIRVSGRNICTQTNIFNPIRLSFLADPEPARIEEISCNQLSTKAEGNFFWSFQGEAISEVGKAHLLAPTPGIYELVVFNDCDSVSTTYELEGIPIEPSLIPNAFSPNGDAYNQFFEMDERLIPAKLSIYNRNGRLVYASEAYQNDWDGGDLPAGVYYYVLEQECLAEVIKGVVQVIR